MPGKMIQMNLFYSLTNEKKVIADSTRVGEAYVICVGLFLADEPARMTEYWKKYIIIRK